MGKMTEHAIRDHQMTRKLLRKSVADFERPLRKKVRIIGRLKRASRTGDGFFQACDEFGLRFHRFRAVR